MTILLLANEPLEAPGRAPAKTAERNQPYWAPTGRCGPGS